MTPQPLSKTPQYGSVFLAARTLTLFSPWLLHLLGVDIILSLLLPVSWISPTLVYRISSRLAYGVWNGIQHIFTKWNKAKITVSGTKLPQHESAIVVSNHVSWTDFYLIQEIALRSQMLGSCRWFAKQQLKWVPFLGWGLWAMGMPLISRQWDKDQGELQRVFRGPKQFKWPIWLISYSEATRFTPAKYLETVQFCKSKNKPIPHFTLWPRTKGFVATVKALGTDSSIRAVYDMTVAYANEKRFMEPPTMLQTVVGNDMSKDRRFHVHVERYDIRDLACKDEQQLAQWLEDRWVEKSKTLKRLHDTLQEGQEWPDENEPER